VSASGAAFLILHAVVKVSIGPMRASLSRL
jgi:hypothetical protein